MIFEYFTELFPYEKFPVEYEAYKALKNIDNLNYIAVPWTQILNSSWIKYPNAKSMSYYFETLKKQNITQQNNFTICQHDNYHTLKFYFDHLKITKVFCPLHDINNTFKNITVIPISFPSFLSFQEKDKNILFSFVGSYNTHPIRQRMKNRIFGENIIFRNTYHIDSDIFNNSMNLKQKEEIEYKDIVERSRFSLCPRGSSPSSVRFWESLEAGAIPILISDFWKLPEWDWENTIIHIKEKDFESMTYKDISDIINSISTNQENIMRINCKQAYNEFGKQNYKKYILSNV